MYQIKKNIKLLFNKIKSQVFRYSKPERITFENFEQQYNSWSATFHDLSPESKKNILADLLLWKKKPIISIVMPVYKVKQEWLKTAIESVRNQIYPHWELCIAEDCAGNVDNVLLLKKYANMDPRIKVVFRTTTGHITASSNSASQLVTSDWIALLDHDDILHPTALYYVAESINANPNAELLYSDEDKINENNTIRSDPYFKYDFNIDLFYAHNMISHLGVYKTTTFRKIGGFRKGFEGSQDYDLVLRFLQHIDLSQIIHIPRVLYHWRIHDSSTAKTINNKSYATETSKRALNDYFKRHGIKAKAKSTIYGFYTNYQLPNPKPLISIIIPVHNQYAPLKKCLENLYQKTSYRNFEVIVVDNNSTDSHTLSFLQKIQKDYQRLSVIVDKTQPFNFSQIMNNAVPHAKGQYLCFLNDSTQVINDHWLLEMLKIAAQPKVGAVGARLWYLTPRIFFKKPKKRLQHGGIIMGVDGIASNKNKNHTGCHTIPNCQFFAMHLIHSVSAVTSACMLVSKKCFVEINGFDDKNTPVAFSDVDFCLRAIEAGYRNIFTPFADLYQYKSATRKYGALNIEFKQVCQYMTKRWEKIIKNDPCYNPNLNILSEGNHNLAYPPRLKHFYNPQKNKTKNKKIELKKLYL
ncbi:MAG: glycosyltransferase [Candidatus Liberibacter psyllaurous]